MCRHPTARIRRPAPDKDATVTIKPDDPNAADRQEAALDKTQDTFHDRLVQLIAEQKKVQVNVEKLTAQYAPLAEKVRKDQEAAPPTPPADPTKPLPPPKEGPKLDPETAKQMAELQKQLSELAKEQDKNTQTASQLNNDLANAAAQADRLKSLPQPLVQQMQSLQQAFEQTAVHGMQNLAQQFNQGANPQAGTPNLPDIHQKSDRLASDLEGLKNRLEAIDEARKGLRDDLAKALADLQRQMLNENGKLSERDLQELRDFLARMREQMKDVQTQEENLLHDAENGGDMKDLEQKQADLDKQMEKLLDAARRLLDAKRDPRRRPNFPNEPYTPDDEEKAPPKDEDGNTSLPNAKKPDGKDHSGDKKPDDAKDDDKDPLDMPALGGPRQVPDPRYEKKRRPVEKKPGDKDDPDGKRDDLESHQNDRLRDLDLRRRAWRPISSRWSRCCTAWSRRCKRPVRRDVRTPVSRTRPTRRWRSCRTCCNRRPCGRRGTCSAECVGRNRPRRGVPVSRARTRPPRRRRARLATPATTRWSTALNWRRCRLPRSRRSSSCRRASARNCCKDCANRGRTDTARSSRITSSG